MRERNETRLIGIGKLRKNERAERGDTRKRGITGASIFAAISIFTTYFYQVLL